MSNVLPHVACFSCGKRIGSYDRTLKRLTSPGLSLGEALGSLGLSSSLRRVEASISRGIPEEEALASAGLDVQRIDKLMAGGPTLLEALTLRHLQSYYPQIKALIDEGYTISEAVASLGLDPQPIVDIVRKGMTIAQAMDLLGIDRTCCRTNILSPAIIPLGAGTVIKEQQPIARIAAPVQSLTSRTPKTTPKSVPTRTTPSPVVKRGLPPRRNIF